MSELSEAVDRYRLICEAKERVTFGKMEYWGQKGDGAEANIYFDGKDVGTIRAEMEDISSGIAFEYAVATYTVEFNLDLPNGQEFSREKDFDVKRSGGNSNARQQLAKAKKWVRDQITPQLRKLRKGVHGPRQLRPRK